jgi:outer membrane receptor protein involved in Fe transport
VVRQPFDNDYLLGDLIISKSWTSHKLISATSIVHQTVDTHYDFSPNQASPTIFDQKNNIVLASNETRLSSHNADGSGWLLGISFVHNSEIMTRRLRPLTPPAVASRLHNETTEAAVFGEATQSLGGTLALTVGSRVSYDRLRGTERPLGDKPTHQKVASRKVEILPSAALSWRPKKDLLFYLRYQEGFRAGGLSIAETSSQDLVTRFRSDEMTTYEFGLSLGRPTDRWQIASALSYAGWRHIQADLVDSAGMPYTTNIGSGRILGFELSARWRATKTLSFEASMFLNDSKLTKPAPLFVETDASELPDIARLGAHMGVQYDAPLWGSLRLTVDAFARYVGRSELGVGPALNIPQGDYVNTYARVRVGNAGFGVSLEASNLLDSIGNRFSLGNPFGVAARNQITPLRPRTIRIGLDTRF